MEREVHVGSFMYPPSADFFRFFSKFLGFLKQNLAATFVSMEMRCFYATEFFQRC